MKKTVVIKIRKILALLGVAIIILLYLATLVFAFIDKSQSKSLLTASIFATFFVALILYAMSLLLKVMKKGQDSDGQEK